MTSFWKRIDSKVGIRKLEKPSTPEEEQAKVSELRAAIGPLTGRLEQFADDACLQRHLRARDWNLKDSTKMLKKTLAWRDSFKPEDIRCASFQHMFLSDIAGISESGNVYRSSIKSKKGHTVVVMHPGRQNTRDGAIQIKQLVYHLENAISNSAEGQEQMIWLIDYKGWSTKNSIPLSVVREIANILQNHYPERLHVAVMHNLPRLFEAIWKMVKPFLDPKTFCKVKFVYAKNTESQKILDELFEKDAVKGMFDDSEDYNFKEYADLMQEDDLKSALYWKGTGAGENMAEQAEIRNKTVPEVILALPIGGLLAQDTICFMKDCQLSVRQHLHDIPELQNVQVSLEESEAKVVQKLRAGDVHLGIVGYDMLREYGEHNEDLTIVHDALGYGAGQLVLMIPALGYYANVNSLKELDAMPRYNHDKTPLRIVTSYPYLAQKFLEENGLKNVELHLIGATSKSHSQSKLLTSLLRDGSVDAVLDLWSTEYEITELLKTITGGTVLNSQAVFVASKRALLERKGVLHVIQDMLQRFATHLTAQGVTDV